MTVNPEKPGETRVGQFYDDQADSYAEFAEGSFSWKYIESPAFDRYISDLYNPDTEVLDLGCGAGRVIRYLAAHGITQANISGIDTSKNLLELARQDLPEVNFREAPASSLPFEAGSFDLITSNMVLHHLDNSELRKAFEEAYRVLKPGGNFFFVDIDPDSSDRTRDPALADTWLTKTTPWGTTVPHFNREPHTLLIDVPEETGFELRAGWALPIEPESQVIDPEEFERYNSKPSRIAARFQRLDEATKQSRQDSQDHQIPSLY